VPLLPMSPIPAEHGRPVVAPAQHAVILVEDSRVVTYSEPIVSWHAEIEAFAADSPLEGDGQEILMLIAQLRAPPAPA
jgi:hypothetical protein